MAAEPWPNAYQVVTSLKKILILFTLVLAALHANGANNSIASLRDDVRTIETRKQGEPLTDPILQLGSDEWLEICFDHLQSQHEYLQYELIHCNADWQPSELLETEYLDGFNLATIDDYKYSRSTSTKYVHYSFIFPNEQIRPTASGNYIIRIFPEADPDQTWATIPIMVTEQSAPTKATISSRTDIDINKSHQQLAIEVDAKNANLEDPLNQLTVKIRQNGRLDNETTLTHPQRIANKSTAIFEHIPQLIFEAGNEYRRIETISVKSPSPQVKSVIFADPFYHFTLLPDESRSENEHFYDQTQHGRFLIREQNSTDSDVEADYVMVHFALHPDFPAKEEIYIEGAFTGKSLGPESKMVYNKAQGVYEYTALLKQGAYNYQYLTLKPGSSIGNPATVEGNKFQTSNEYQIAVYGRNHSDRYDRLLYVITAYSNQ